MLVAMPTVSRAMNIRRLIPADVAAYRQLMLDAYALHPDGFTSSVAERSALPIAWCESRLSAEAEASELVLGAFLEPLAVAVSDGFVSKVHMWCDLR